MKTITTLVELQQFLATVPDGTKADVLSNDIECGNFDTMSLEYPDGAVLDINYTGKVALHQWQWVEIVGQEDGNPRQIEAVKMVDGLPCYIVNGIEYAENELVSWHTEA